MADLICRFAIPFKYFTMKKSLLVSIFYCFTSVLLAQTPGQTLRGTVNDADNARPIFGASVVLLGTNPLIGTTTSESGSYTLTFVPVGRYQLQVSHLGYQALTVAEVLVESGRETVLNVQLQERADSLQTIVVKASGYRPVSPVNSHTLTVEEQFRFPATFFDPARLAMAHPGVAGNNDGTNVISVRGNSPNALQWRLEGVEIVNPNHTANAGTFGDRPTGAGGGVNILSAQLLGTSTLFTGAFPAQYGNSLGGIMDMHLRKGNDQRHELIAQAGFLGIEAAVEGPISVGSRPRSPVTNHQSPSFLLNYRYSFTGLLTSMGVDFGDEETAFQDVAFHVSLPSGFTFFGLGGKSSTLYRSPTDSANIDKERFNIDFNSKMGATGLTYVRPVGKHSVWQNAFVVSALEHDRNSSFAFDFLSNNEREYDLVRLQKTALSSRISYKINASNHLEAGIQVTFSEDVYSSLLKKNSKTYFLNIASGDILRVQPFAEWHSNFGNGFDLTLGAQLSSLTQDRTEIFFEPRMNLGKMFGSGKLVLAYGAHSQQLAGQLSQASFWSTTPKSSRAHHLVLGYKHKVRNALIFNAETYFQYLYDVAIQSGEGSTFSAINMTDFSVKYLELDSNLFPKYELENSGQGRNYGLDLSLQKYLTDRYFFLLAGSLYRSEYTAADGKWHATRFDGGHTLNLTAGREVAKQKNGKTIINGISGRVAWLGGFRDTPIDLVASKEVGYTVFQQQFAFTEKLDDYFRIDLRLYKKWNKTGKNSMLSLDIQNITSRKNAQYHYYDSVQDKVLLKRQLGLIPILTWRGEF